MQGMPIRLIVTGLLGLVLGFAVAPGVSYAGGEATVTVDVISGKKGASGTSEGASKHGRVLSRIGGFGGWKLEKSFQLRLGLGKTATQGVGTRSFSATLHSLSADKARTTFVVVDPRGKDHKLTSQLSNGASTVIIAEAPDGTGVQVFIIRVRY
jgi:hypothetical protein